jgi:hypothetical protein
MPLARRISRLQPLGQLRGRDAHLRIELDHILQDQPLR